MRITEKTVEVDEAFTQRVLQRLGRTEGKVQVRSEEWDLGFCDTCSHLERGFSVYVDDKQVWPNDDYLSNFGGYIYADEQGAVEGNTLTTFGYFFEWLDGNDLAELALREDEDGDDEEE